ncbi:MAG: sulfatase [Anaerolineae bacterium]|nr:sulfatase [Anaerolineae bacterium]
MKHLKRLFLPLLLILTISPMAVGCQNLFVEDERPNILIIVTDDQRYDTMEYMPETTAALFDQGVEFKHAFVTTPLCCPSRASILTGSYAHEHGVLNNDLSLEKPTFIELMHENGYYTGLVGKYLNSWKGEPRPEYDYWVSYKHGETRYENPNLNVNGEWIRHQGEYVTYTLGNYVIDFLQQAGKKNKPFILLYTPNAPHSPVSPAPEDANLFDDLPPHRPPSFNEEDVSDKPNWLANEPLLPPDVIVSTDVFRLNQLRTLVSLDRAIGKILQELENQGELDNTFILYISDNGVHWGEHRLVTKNRYYDEVSRVPFAIRYPPLISQPYLDEEHVVGNIDIAPTALDLAGIPIPEEMDGMSILDLFSGNTKWRDGILLEGWPGRGVFSAVHSGKYVYAEIFEDTSEFYDLTKDPYQLENLINDPAYRDLIEEHMQWLKVLQNTP